MELEARKVLEVMREKDVSFLFHANTLVTSCSCLMKGSLLSRGTVEQSGLPQTTQYSDSIDKKYGIWFDIFLDTADVHQIVNRRNLYGPVLFQLDVSLLDNKDMPPLWVTKKNPTKWQDTDLPADRWFGSIAELKTSFGKYDLDHMLVLRHLGGLLPLSGCLTRVVVDDPQRKLSTGFDAYRYACAAIPAAGLSDLENVSIDKRACSRTCGCKTEYKIKQVQEIDKNFGS